MKKLLLSSLVTFIFCINLAVGNDEINRSTILVEEEQLTLNDIFKDNPNLMKKTTEDWNLKEILDMESSWQNGTLENDTKRLTPLFDERSISSTPHDVEDLYSANRLIWSTKDGARIINGKKRIYVCWMNPTNSNEKGRKITESAVKSTWEHHGLVEFYGWKKCPGNIEGIKIKIEDVRPESFVGNSGKKKYPSMHLNFDFNIASMQGCRGTKTKCIWSIAVHEFGHALGFLHEQDRDDTPKWCSKNHPRTVHSNSLNPTKLTSWDKNSVMDYCFDIYKERIQLSDCDIAGYHATYGKPNKPKYIPKCSIKSS